MPGENDTQPNKPDTWAKIGAVLGGVGTVGGAVLPILAAKSTESVFVICGTIVIFALTAGGFLLWFCTKTIKIGVSAPETYRRFPRWTAVLSWVFGLAVAFGVLGVRIGYRDEVFPLAKLDRVDGSFLWMEKGEEGDGFSQMRYVPVTRRDPITEQERLIDLMPYPSVNLTISRHGAGKVRVESVKVTATPVDLETAPVETSAGSRKEDIPHLYVARLSRAAPGSRAELLIDGKLTSGEAYLDDERQDAQIFVLFGGDPGVYKVTIVVTVQEQGGGRKQDLPATKELIVTARYDDHQE